MNCSKLLQSHSFEELSRHFISIQFCPDQELQDYFTYIEAFFFKAWKRRFDQTLEFNIQLNAIHWTNPWSIATFTNEVKSATEALNSPELNFFQHDDESQPDEFWFSCKIRSAQTIVDNEIKYWSHIIREILSTVEKSLEETYYSEALTAQFTFPASIRTACEQYLLYFVQFLSDLGIEAEANINHQAQDVLFSVTPKDKGQALSAIQAALIAYLCIPSSPTFASDAALSNDVAVRQLEANVYHLKGQLALNQSILQAKDATIDALQLTNFQQRQMLDITAYNSRKAEEQSESVMDGIVQITKYEGKGFVVDLPKLIRRLKRSFTQ